jgi:hypothetical protein
VAESSAKKLKCGRRKSEVAGEIDDRKLTSFISGKRQFSTIVLPFENFYVKYDEPNGIFWHKFFILAELFPKVAEFFGRNLFFDLATM